MVCLIGSSAYSWMVGHQGLLHDEECGLVYVQHRYDEPGLGRWMSRDPIGEPGQMMTDFTQVPTPEVWHLRRMSRTSTCHPVIAAQVSITSSLGSTAGNTPSLWKYADGMNLYLDERSNPITRLDPSGLDIFINCNSSPHLSICVGDLKSSTCFSFGLQSRWEVFNPWNNDGIVYIDPSPTGSQQCLDCHLKTTPALGIKMHSIR